LVKGKRWLEWLTAKSGGKSMSALLLKPALIEFWSVSSGRTTGRRVDQEPGDAQKTFDMLATKEKEMIWVENTTRRFRDGYNYFGRYPEKVLPFFEKYMK
jgi:hypothetical protein